jgi:lysophospholipase L1-like esterase
MSVDVGCKRRRYLKLRARFVTALLSIIVVASVGVAVSGTGGEDSGKDVPSVPGPGDSVLVVGDSWSAGRSAEPGYGYVDLLTDRYGWDTTVDAESGTGYVEVRGQTGSVFASRIRQIDTSVNPQLVILQGGLNDEGVAGARLRRAVSDAIDAATSRFPAAKVVLLGPSAPRWPVAKGIGLVSEEIAEVAKSTGLEYISPLDQHWVTTENFYAFIDEATSHPSDQGHSIFADHVARNLERIYESQQQPGL